MLALGIGFFIVGTWLIAAGRQHVMLHALQLEHYESARLIRWAHQHQLLWHPRRGAVAVAAGGVAMLVSSVTVEAVTLVVGFASGVLFSLLGLADLRRDQIKPLVFTPRSTRLYALSLALSGIALSMPLVFLAVDIASIPAAVTILSLVGVVVIVGSPWLLVFSNWLLAPIQALENRRFIRSASRKLEDVGPVVIGVTGSYGKTSTKVCIQRVCEGFGPSLATPASFNSFLGVNRAINEELRKEHRSFVAEMGMYRKGDISEICEFVQPSIGVLTEVGPAHLERMGSMEAIFDAKCELAEALPREGLYITRADRELCLASVARTSARTCLVSLNELGDATIWAQDFAVEEGRSKFTLARRGVREVEYVRVEAQLLGQPNVANLLCAAAVGVELGLGLPAVGNALASVAPLPHRLAPIPNASAGLIVIDDSYNSNPVGAMAALAVLRDHQAQRRILVTPGMVELGGIEDDENASFGEAAADVCDVVILVGSRQTTAVRVGLSRGGFADGLIFTVESIWEAQEVLSNLTRRGDVILFENDLPDLYSGVRG